MWIDGQVLILLTKEIVGQCRDFLDANEMWGSDRNLDFSSVSHVVMLIMSNGYTIFPFNGDSVEDVKKCFNGGNFYIHCIAKCTTLNQFQHWISQIDIGDPPKIDGLMEIMSSTFGELERFIQILDNIGFKCSVHDNFAKMNESENNRFLLIISINVKWYSVHIKSLQYCRGATNTADLTEEIFITELVSECLRI